MPGYRFIGVKSGDLLKQHGSFRMRSKSCKEEETVTVNTRPTQLPTLATSSLRSEICVGNRNQSASLHIFFAELPLVSNR